MSGDLLNNNDGRIQNQNVIKNATPPVTCFVFFEHNLLEYACHTFNKTKRFLFIIIIIITILQ